MAPEAIQKFTLNRGFSRWHVKWQLDSVIKSDVKEQVTTYFKTVVHDYNVGEFLPITWSMTIDNAHPDGTRWIGLRRTETAIPPVPAVYRMVLFDAKKGIVFNHGGMFVFDGLYQHMWHVLSSDQADVFVNGKDASWHIFLSIPIEVVQFPQTIGDVENENEISHGQMPNELVRCYEKLLEAVLEGQDDANANTPVDEATGQEDDEVDDHPDSDISLVVPDKDGTERIFNCHRTILTLRSAYFRQLIRRRRATSRCNLNVSLNVSMVELDESCRFIHISDVDAETMVPILRYLYVGEMPSSIDTSETDEHELALKLFAAATKFNLIPLKDYVLTLLIQRYCDDQNRAQQIAIVDNAKEILEDSSKKASGSWKKADDSDNLQEGLKESSLKSVCMEQLATFVFCTQDTSVLKYSKEETGTEILKMAKDYLFTLNCVCVTAKE